jgi:long-chain acyl-CoA synthetase
MTIDRSWPACCSIENDLMTPSMKLKRPQLQQRFQKDIDAMYKELKAAAAARR